MALRVNNVEVGNVLYNGQQVEKLQLNGTTVWENFTHTISFGVCSHGGKGTYGFMTYIASNGTTPQNNPEGSLSPRTLNTSKGVQTITDIYTKYGDGRIWIRFSTVQLTNADNQRISIKMNGVEHKLNWHFNDGGGATFVFYNETLSNQFREGILYSPDNATWGLQGIIIKYI